MDAFAANPQFKLLLPEVDRDKFMSSCNISLMQDGGKEEKFAIGNIFKSFNSLLDLIFS